MYLLSNLKKNYKLVILIETMLIIESKKIKLYTNEHCNNI